MSKSQNTASHIKVGKLGEQIASRFLAQEGFSVRERNYLKKWGEIDIVAQKGAILYFFEVKTIVRQGNGTNGERMLPEYNAHPKKIARLARAIESYRMERRIAGEWRLELIAIELEVASRRAFIRRLLL